MPVDTLENEETQEAFDPRALQIEVEESVPDIVPNHEASKERPRRALFPLSSAGKQENKEQRAPKKPRKPTPKVKKGSLVEPIENVYTTIGALLLPFDPHCGNALIVHAHTCAEKLDELAQHNDAVRRALLALTQTSVWGAVLAAHAPLLLAIAVHHVPAFKGETAAMMNVVKEAAPQEDGRN